MAKIFAKIQASPHVGVSSLLAGRWLNLSTYSSKMRYSTSVGWRARNVQGLFQSSLIGRPYGHIPN